MFSFTDNSLDSPAVNSLVLLHRQSCVGKLTFLLPNLNLSIYFPLTIITIITKNQAKFWVYLTKINTKFFLW